MVCSKHPSRYTKLVSVHLENYPRILCFVLVMCWLILTELGGQALLFFIVIMYMGNLWTIVPIFLKFTSFALWTLCEKSVSLSYEVVPKIIHTCIPSCCFLRTCHFCMRLVWYSDYITSTVESAERWLYHQAPVAPVLSIHQCISSGPFY